MDSVIDLKTVPLTTIIKQIFDLLNKNAICCKLYACFVYTGAVYCFNVSNEISVDLTVHLKFTQFDSCAAYAEREMKWPHCVFRSTSCVNMSTSSFLFDFRSYPIVVAHFEFLVFYRQRKETMIHKIFIFYAAYAFSWKFGWMQNTLLVSKMHLQLPSPVFLLPNLRLLKPKMCYRITILFSIGLALLRAAHTKKMRWRIG